MKTPVLFLVFNRPDTTAKVFAAIRKTRPEKLFVAADGPRENKPGEKERCDATRKITEKIDWPCEVKRLYREKNLGCKVGVSSAISWFFDNVEEGIILEDDCLPDQSFFKFCSEMLKRYRHNTRIMHISGDNYQPDNKKQHNSYYFSYYPNIWGWATWRRCWKKYRVDISGWNKSKKILNKFNIIERAYWSNNFDLVANNRVDTWDYQWIYNVFNNKGIAVISGENLINNIGFNNDATHTKNDPGLNFTTKSIRFPLKMKNKVEIDKIRDSYTAKKIFKINLIFVLYQYYKKYIIFGSRKIKEVTNNLPYKINTIKVILYHLLNKKLIFNGKEKISIILWNKKIIIPASHPLPLYTFLYKNYSTNLFRIAGYVGKRFPESVYIDVGANIGDSVLLIRKACENKIYCVEGNKEYTKLLRKNTRKYNNISIVNKFLGEKDETVYVNINGESGTGSLSLSGGEAIELKTLDSLFHDLPNIKLIKTDTDGFDAKVLRGGKNIITKYKPLLFFELDEKFLCQKSDKGVDLINYLISKKYHRFVSYDNYGNYIKSISLTKKISETEYQKIFNYKRYLYFDVLAVNLMDNDLFLEIAKKEKKYFS